jgi:hypothetical protein
MHRPAMQWVPGGYWPAGSARQSSSFPHGTHWYSGPQIAWIHEQSAPLAHAREQTPPAWQNETGSAYWVRQA